MKKTIKLISFLGSALLSTNLVAADFFDSMMRQSNLYQVDHKTRIELMSLLETCGSPNNIDPGCAINQLQETRVKITDPSFAKGIVDGYKKVISIDTRRSECVNNQLADANYVLGNCFLDMNYYILSELDPEYTKSQTVKCLLTQLGTIAQGGNYVAAIRLDMLGGYMAGQQNSKLWRDSMKQNLTEEEFNFLSDCYN